MTRNRCVGRFWPRNGYARWTAKAGGTCFVCFAEFVTGCTTAGTGSADGTGRPKNCVKPRTAAIEHGSIHTESGGLFGGSSQVCLTQRDVADQLSQGKQWRDLNRTCTKCPRGFTWGTLDGLKTCYQCPKGQNLINGCCR